MRLALARQRWRETKAMLLRHRNEDSLEQLFLVTVEERRKAEAGNFPQHLRITNAVQFVVLWNWDLTVLLGLLGESRAAWNKGWHRKLTARVLALTIYEAAEKLTKFLDGQWNRKWSPRKALRVLELEDRFAPELDRLQVELAGLIAQHEPLLSGIRNNIMGHRDQDVSAQIDWIRQTDIDEIEWLGIQMLTWTTKLVDAFTGVARALPPIHAELDTN